MPIFQQKLEKGVDEIHLTGAPVIKVLIVVAHSSLGNDTNENKENDSEKNCKIQNQIHHEKYHKDFFSNLSLMCCQKVPKTC